MFLQLTIEYFLLGLALAMDCFSVSITCGIIQRRMGAQVWAMAFLFGFFQAAQVFASLAVQQTLGGGVNAVIF